MQFTKVDRSECYSLRPIEIKHLKFVSILEPIEVFFVVRKACRVARWSNFVENIINKKSYEPARAFRDLWSLVMF